MTNDEELTDESRRLGDYELHQAWEGFASVRQVSSGEIMHSRTSPIEEAQHLYVEQAHLAERLRAGEGTEPLVLWDVGLGAAANAMAAIKCYEDAAAAGPVRELRIVSFENDLDSLRLALDHLADFPYLRHEAPAAILADGRWKSRTWPGLSLALLLGDFPGTIRSAPFAPDLIFYDMFSTKTSTQLWSFRTFRSLFEACVGRAAELFTYTCSTANRAAMLAAGFHVARGRNAGAKIETTIALTPAAARDPQRPAREILSGDWLAKWARSAAKFPADIALAERPHFEKLIREHEQFQKFAAAERLPSTTQNSE